ncbi:glycosyltransferase [Sinomicrobium weinanense]|uniref:Glycosyltransferase n=1 Tax=Sinomicrobium weinanense TaxID=2842200 RepID=A0A926JW28_9FLAO|nr:glycosyltransferase [Sinomicrobium weinanense]MBC9798647.1 glycosyltransferase [Sinomicrobium weinanense]MBU3122367.1 glycosyltransferase [Sinomicrobium weinanense]
MHLDFSFIIPVYNRPGEVEELLESMVHLDFDHPFEVVIIEDGSTIPAKEVADSFSDRLHISYYFKENSGPGDSRNYGMQKARGNYFIILDSDCILPPHYLREVHTSLKSDYVHCYGGPDTAHSSFTDLQKAINYAMTSTITTGGIRGKKNAVGKFQPRSFNMGISREAFQKTGGFGKIHPGEDPDLTIRLWAVGYDTRFLANAFVYHKRRISWSKFFKQVYKFGMTRPILNRWHPHTEKTVYWLPALFVLGLIFSMLLWILGIPVFAGLYALFFLIVFIDALYRNKNVKVAFLSVFAVLIQFSGYGYGFIKSTFAMKVLNKDPQKVFPELFFN